MSRAKAAPAVGAAPSTPHYSFFCYVERQPLMEVLTGPDNAARQEQAVLLLQTVEEVMGRACAQGDDSLDGSTAYLLRFAVDAASALVHSLEVKE